MFIYRYRYCTIFINAFKEMIHIHITRIVYRACGITLFSRFLGKCDKIAHRGKIFT